MDIMVLMVLFIGALVAIIAGAMRLRARPKPAPTYTLDFIMVPDKEESYEAFLHRAVTDPRMVAKYPNESQRLGVCVNIWHGFHGLLL